MAKVLSVEVGYSLTKICEVDYKVKNPKVYNNLTITTPTGVLEDGFIKDPDALAEAIKKALDSKGIKTKQAVFSITSTKIANREVFLPLVKENKIESLIEINAGDYFPVNISNYKLTHSILGQVDGEDGAKQYKLIVLAAPKDMLESYYTLAEKAGLTVSALDYSGNSIAVSVKGAFKEGTHMVAKIDERSSILTIFSDGEMILQRTVPYGGDVAVETIMESEEAEGKVSYESALEMLRKKPCIRQSINPELEDPDDEDDDEIKKFRLDVTESLGMLSNGILRVIDYYNSRNSDKQIENIYVTGYAENFIGLDSFMSNEIGAKVQSFNELENTGIDKSMVNAGEFVSCIGAVIAPLDFIPDEHSDKKKKKKVKVTRAEDGTVITGTEKAGPSDMTRLAVGVFVAGVLVAVILAVISLLGYFSAKNRNDELKAKEAELSPVEAIYYDYNYTSALYKDVVSTYLSTTSRNDEINNFLLELQDKLPQNVNVISINGDVNNISINMDVDSKEAAAQTVVEIRNFDTVETVSVANLSEQIEEDGSITVNFTIDCTYKLMLQETEDEAAEAQAE